MNQQLIAAVAGLAVAAAGFSRAQADDIHLDCDGVARHHETQSTYVYGQAGGRWASGNAYTRAPVEDDAELFIDITGDGARIKLPAVLLPVVRTTSDEGWRPLKDVQLGDTEINAKFALNFINNPSVTINRVTGHIDLAGLGGGFSGECRPYDATAAARKF